MSSNQESSHLSISVDTASAPSDDVEKRTEGARELALERARSLIGRVVSDRYRIVDLLAMGGVGAVYVGEHALMHKRIAVKILHPESEDHPEIVARFEREALVGAHISHPNIANATDFGKLDDGSYFLILEYVDGKNLADVIRGGPLEPRVAVRIARQIASGLAAAHDLGIIHRDLKPRNVMLDASMVPKIIDFGFAKVSVGKLPLTISKEGRPPSRLTGVGVIFGTINYLAPEAAHGMDAVDERADLYALGIMMYEMLAGKHPFDATDPAEMFSHHRVTSPPRFAERAPSVSVPSEIEALVRKLLEKDPYERFQRASDVIEALDALPLPREPDAKPEPEPAPEPAPEPEPALPSGEASTPAPTRKKKKKVRQGRTAAPAERPAPSPLNYGLAVVAIVAVLVAAFFAMR